MKNYLNDGPLKTPFFAFPDNKPLTSAFSPIVKLIASLVLFFLPLISGAQVYIDTTYSAQKLVESFMGEGVSIFNVRVHGNKSSFGYFTMDRTYFPMTEGILLSTGRASACANPNLKANTSTSMKEGAGSDSDLGRMVTRQIFNVSVIEFDFIPLYDSLFFDYVFASEEYPEYVGTSFNDVFCLMISGPNITKPVNLARVGTPPVTVMINNVNHKKNQKYFIANYNYKPTADVPYVIEYDGFTTLLTASCKVSRGKVHHVKIAIGNVNDFSYDSGVFLRAGSFGSRGETGGKSRFILPFDFDSYNVKHEYLSLFDSLGKVLKQNPKWKLSVLGHTDSIGSIGYNDTLSAERAWEVANMLIAAGVNPKQLFVKGYGYSKPLSDNTTDDGRSRNRRVEIVIMKKD